MKKTTINHQPTDLISDAKKLAAATEELLELINDMVLIARCGELPIPKKGPGRVILANAAILAVRDRIGCMEEAQP